MVNLSSRDHEVLEVEATASFEEIKQAYRDLVNVWHPDRFGHSPRLREKAERKLKRINLAFSRLTSAMLCAPHPAPGTPPPPGSRAPRSHAASAGRGGGSRPRRETSGSDANDPTGAPQSEGRARAQDDARKWGAEALRWRRWGEEVRRQEAAEGGRREEPQASAAPPSDGPGQRKSPEGELHDHPVSAPFPTPPPGGASRWEESVRRWKEDRNRSGLR